MKTTESITEFYKYKFNGQANEPDSANGHFNVFRIADWINAGSYTASFIRRSFYKIMLFQGDNTFHFGDRSIDITGNTLLFFNPQVLYTSDILHPDTKGYYCIFNEEFFRLNHRLNLKEFDLFKPQAQPVFPLNDEQSLEIELLFEKSVYEGIVVTKHIRRSAFLFINVGIMKFHINFRIWHLYKTIFFVKPISCRGK